MAISEPARRGLLAGRTALVTGGAAGIGRAIVERFLDEGAAVLAADRDEDALAALAEAHRGRGLRVRTTDVADPADVAGLGAWIGDQAGTLDILVNNAGIYPVAGFAEMDFAAWRRVLAVDLDSLFLVTKACLPLLARDGGGRIVNIGSSSFFSGPPGATHYLAAKGGMIGFSRSLAAELGAERITVNVVAPGLTSTATLVDRADPALIRLRAQQRALAREQHAEDVVGPVLFLSGPDSGFVTGQVLVADGGIVRH